MLRPASGETPTRTPFGTWLYCFDAEESRHQYLHLECDMVADDHDGCCLGCGRPSPLGQTMAPRPPAPRCGRCGLPMRATGDGFWDCGCE